MRKVAVPGKPASVKVISRVLTGAANNPIKSGIPGVAVESERSVAMMASDEYPPDNRVAVARKFTWFANPAVAARVGNDAAAVMLLAVKARVELMPLQNKAVVLDAFLPLTALAFRPPVELSTKLPSAILIKVPDALHAAGALPPMLTVPVCCAIAGVALSITAARPRMESVIFMLVLQLMVIS